MHVRFPVGAGTRTDPGTAGDTEYDVVIVGSGVSGSIIAKQLSAAGRRVAVLEAGPAEDQTLRDYDGYLERFYLSPSKDNQSPYPDNPFVPMPRDPLVQSLRPGQTDATSGYLVQNAPFATDTTYTRVFGGTTMHWEAKTPRMLPEDFETGTLYGQGRDWPLSYDDIAPYYTAAERELGVSADVDDQRYLGVHFDDGYVYPMKGMPASYLDQLLARDVDGMPVELGGEHVELHVRPFPQARNGIPNRAYDGGKGYVPLGAVSTYQTETGGRCQGNNNCVPLCPVQAKYNARKTLAAALQTGRVDVVARAVAHRVHIDSESGRVTEIEFRYYSDDASSGWQTGRIKGRLFVLATNAIENPRLMLASGLVSSSGLMGRNLMDHAYLLTWALMPEVAGTMRGTNCTSGIVDLRGGSFRRDQAAFAVDIHNDGWGWATGAPVSDLLSLVDDGGRFGDGLRQGLVDTVSRQLELAFMIDVPPVPTNRVSVDPSQTDAIGNMRPVISFEVPEYSMRGAAYARQLSKRIFARIGAEDHTSYDPGFYGYVSYDGSGYEIRGGNHLAGTHIMGKDAATSVVDEDQRSWDHGNLYLVGGGSMPSVSTSNITLTIAALCLRTSEAILAQLVHDEAPLEIAS